MYNHAAFLRQLRSQRALLADAGIIAMDAQPQTSTPVNSGIPEFMATFVSPEILRILFAPMKVATILGDERKVGDWVTDVSMFPVTERTGSVTSYGDYVNGGSAGANYSFPQRQSYHYQTVVQIGEQEEERVALARINLVNEKREGATLALNKFQNRSYAYGVSGLQNYGLLNDPALPASIQPGPKAYGTQAHGPWITAGVLTATPNEVLTDIQSLYYTLAKQAAGNVELSVDVPLVLAMDPYSQVALTTANNYGVIAMNLIKTTFPNLRVETAVEYATTGGNLVQLIATKVEGQQSGFVSFTEKLRSHRVIYDLSSWKQKISQGSWGAIIRQPWAIASMLGV